MTAEPQRLELTVLSQMPEAVPILADWLETQWHDDFADGEAVARLKTYAEGGESLPMALVILADGDAVGMVAIEERTSGDTDSGLWVGRLYVLPEHRGKGIGRLLLTTATRVAWQFGHEKVYTSTSQTELMEALGWQARRETQKDGELITFFEYEKPPAPPSYYERIGGEEKVRQLVDRFYDLMHEKPDAHDVRQMHAKSLKASREKLFEFLSGWMGGPNLYIEKRGHPRLRMRHMPFSIGTDARDQWLMCMDQALDEVVEDEGVREELRDSFVRIADHMRNRRGP